MRTFPNCSCEAKTMLFNFLKEQYILGVHFTFKKGGEEDILKKYPVEGSSLIDPEGVFTLSGTIESISKDGILHTKKIIAMGNSYTILDTEFMIPVELLDDIQIIQ